jgi:hypothetical protein
MIRSGVALARTYERFLSSRSSMASKLGFVSASKAVASVLVSTVALALSADLWAGAEGGPPADAPAWSFESGAAGWTSSMTTPLESRGGALCFRATGHDPILLSPELAFEPSPLDAVDICLQASVSGT